MANHHFLRGDTALADGNFQIRTRVLQPSNPIDGDTNTCVTVRNDAGFSTFAFQITNVTGFPTFVTVYSFDATSWHASRILNLHTGNFHDNTDDPSGGTDVPLGTGAYQKGIYSVFINIH